LTTAPFRAALADALRSGRSGWRCGTQRPALDQRGGPTFRLASPLALSHILRAPGQLGLGRAYVAGAIEVDDVDAALDLLDGWSAPPGRHGGQGAHRRRRAARRRADQGPARARRRAGPRGRRHSIARDRRSVRHHYDVSNDFFALMLDESMTYSCAVWSRGAQTLEEAQRTKSSLVCTKLGLQGGERVLDVGCGWGSFAVHAAREHGAQVTGITLSEPQAALARERAAAAGVADRVDIRVADYRELDTEPFDAIASIGMVEHVGVAQIDAYAARLAALLKPGGHLLNHASPACATATRGRPVLRALRLPDAAPLHLSRILHALEAAGFVTEHVEGFAADYARTLREWARRLESRHAEAEALAGAERMRVWAVYLRAARRGFESGFTSLYQVRAVRGPMKQMPT